MPLLKYLANSGLFLYSLTKSVGLISARDVVGVALS